MKKNLQLIIAIITIAVLVLVTIALYINYNPIGGTLLDKDIQAECDSGNTVYRCGDLIQVTLNNLGGGSSYYKFSQDEGFIEPPLRCPVVAPDSMEQECLDILQAKENGDLTCVQLC